MKLDTAAKLVDITGRGTKVELSTTKGTIVGRHCIITASTNVILDRIKFDGGLPKRHQDALEKLRLGSFDHIALELPGNPLGLPRDDVVFEKASGPRTGALTANIGGTTLSTVSVGGKFGRDLAAQGDKAMVEFAVEWLGAMFGPGDAVFGTIDTWITWRLSGGETYVTDHSNASCTGVYDFFAHRWDETLIEMLELPAASCQRFGITRVRNSHVGAK